MPGQAQGEAPLRAFSRRQFIGLGLGAVAFDGALASPASALRKRAAGAWQSARHPAGPPARQFAWNSTLARDASGNPIPPRHDRLLFFDVRRRPTAASADELEAALRTLERAFPWGPDGVLFTVGWGPRYFSRVLGLRSPVPRPTALSPFEDPVLDEYDMCLHLACDNGRSLAEIEAALTNRKRLRGADGPLDVSRALRWRETRTGFVGAGMPARRQNVAGIPPGRPVPRGAPLFMGFKSGLRKNQATEESVAIRRGPFAGGTTMHVSYMKLDLGSWYERNTEAERVQKMYAAQATPAQVQGATTDAPNHSEELDAAIEGYGVVGHAQAVAQARRGGRPVILRRDFDTVDGGHAGLHFVSVQRSIDDFVRTRRAMNAAHAKRKNPALADSSNNGINSYMRVLRRANYIVPPRHLRSFPLLAARRG